MPGEISKSIGESGEEVAKKLFKEILGYENILTGKSIDCFNGENHKTSKKASDKTTHGIDGLIGDVSELANKVLDIGYISVKKTVKVGYKKSELSKHIRDIAYGMECFAKSKLLSDYKKNFSKIREANLVGILIYFSDLDDLYKSVNEFVVKYNIPQNLYFDNLIILDNKKISFLIDTIYNDKTKFGTDNVSFVYHNSGLNPSIQNYYGSKIPIYYLYSPIIVTRIVDNDKILLKFYYEETFSEDILRGMIDLAIDFDKLDAISTVYFSFKDFVKSTNIGEIENIMLQYKSNINTTKFEITGHFPTLKNM